MKKETQSMFHTQEYCFNTYTKFPAFSAGPEDEELSAFFSPLESEQQRASQ